MSASLSATEYRYKMSIETSYLPRAFLFLTACSVDNLSEIPVKQGGKLKRKV